MSDVWVENNNRYLAASLEWLRLRLQKLAPPEETTSTGTRWWGKDQSVIEKGSSLDTATKARDDAAKSDPPPALIALAQRFSLSSFECDTLLLCAAMEFDPGMGALCARVQGATSRNFPTFGLALSVFDDPSWDALSAHRPLRYARLIEVSSSSAAPLTASPLRVDERVANFLKGLNVIDERLAASITPLGVGSDRDLSPSQIEIATKILDRLRSAAVTANVPVVQLIGTDAGSRTLIAQHVCRTLNRRLYRLSAEVTDMETFARLWQRESFLLPVALYIDVENPESLTKLLSRDLGLAFLGVRESALQLSTPTISVETPKPLPAEQRDAWATLLSEEDQPKAPLLAGQFNLNLRDIGEAASRSGDIWETCREITRPRLDLLAQRLETKATWDELVIPDEQLTLMRQIAGHVRERHKVYEQWGFSRSMNRGFGISALFAGESGTGKTMAAEVIANDLRLNLYRIDLSAVVSKYIGETEKNLRKLFDAAEQGGAILFFDEADALFGKRSEVKDSHDRYANIEINYLLQRMEAFSGLAILATNMKSALDPAFMRRLRFIVNFPFPGVKERKLIWEKALPAQTPKQGLDYERLARLNISGGNIHSIALNAAFAAAQNGQCVTMPILLAAARTEMRKLDKGVNEAEFR